MKKQYSNKSGKKASGHYSLGNKKQARKPLITALEPRLLLDGAAVATAVDVLTDSQLHDASQIDNSHQGSDTSFVVAPTEVRAVDPSLNNGKKEVVFIEDNVADYQSLIDGANTGVEVVLLDSTQDGLAQMAEWAKTHSDYDAIHVISHGAEGQVNLGGFSLDNITVKTRSADLAQLGAALNEEGDLLLYGCSVASGEGQDFIEALAQTTKADVTASDDLTGAAGKGGDWVLEKSIGQIDVAALQDVNYQGTLANVTFGFESGVSGVGSKTVTQTKDGETLTVVATENFGDSTQTTTYVDGSNSISTYTGSQFTSQLEFTISGKVFDFTSIKIYNANADATFTFTPNDGAAFTTSTISSDQTVTIDLSSAGFQGVSNITMTSSDSLGVVVDFDSVVLTNITAASDTTAPTVTSIVRQTPSGSTTNADSVVYRVTFDEAVSGIDTTDFNVSGTTATVTNVSSAGGNTYDVTVSGGDLVALNSTVTLSFASGQNITDTAGNALTATTPTGTNNSIYDVVNTPTVTTGDNTGDNLTFSNYTEDLADGGGLSLVEALHYASANQTVAFDLASGSTVNMNGGTLTVASGVTFDTDAMSALTISNGTLSLGGNVTFTNGTSDVLTVSSKLAGSNMLIKSGAGTLNLTSNANGSSSFATTVSAGTLAIGSVSNIGSGAISLSDATTFKVTEITSLANSVTLTGNSTIQTDGRLTLNNTVSGSGYTLTKAGSQSLTLAGTNSGSSLATTITAGNLIISSDANLGSGELTLNGGTLYLQSASDIITHDITLGSSGGTIQVTGSADATVSGNITGSGALTKGGGRVLTLGGSNSFSGGFNIAGSANSGGTNVIVTDGTNLGTGAVTLTKGLQFTGLGTITNDFVLNGGLISNANSVILSGILSGSGAMEKVDTGSLTLSGASNSWDGTATVSAGTLTGTTSSLTGNIINNAAVEFSQSTAGEYSKVISGTGTVTKSGSGILTLSGVNTYTGSTMISAGGLTLIGGSNIADTSAVTVASGASLTLSGENETIGSLAGAGNVVLGYRLTMGGNNTDTTFSGVISSTNTSGITKTGSGIFTLSGTNTYTGATTVSAGNLVASGGSAIADASAVTVASGATFELDASVSETVGSIAGAGSIVANGGTLTVGGDNSSTTFSGVMSERADALSLVKIGSGTLTLSGNNTYTGATTLSGGTLSVTGTMNGSGAGVVTVNAGTLEGSGTINSAVTVNAGATLSAGVAANTGTLTINGNLFLDEGSTLSATLSGASNYDKIVVNGSVELNNAQLTLSGDYVVPAAAEAQSFELLSNDGSDAITGNFFSLTEGDAKTFKDVDLATSYVGSTGNDFLLTGPTIASVTGVSATTDDGYYKVGDTIEITVTFSKAVTVDTTNGTPQLTLETGTTDRAATYVSGSGTNTLTFNYTVQDGDTSADLDYLSTAALVLSDGSIKDGTYDAILTLPTLNASGSLAANKAIVIDTTAPDAPTVDLSSDSDTGSSSTDNITNDNTPTLTGTAEANATVTLYDTDDTTSLGTTTADGSGNWTITSSALSAGTHTLTTKVTDAAGNVSLASSGLTITIDTAGPILSSSSPVDDAVQVTQSGDIILTFDEDIAKGYDEITLINVTTGATVETFDVLNGGNLTYSGNTLTLNPTNDLEEATTYAIRVDGNAVRDIAGNTYAGISDNTTLNFTTGVTDSVAPTFLSIQRTSDAVITGSTTSFTLTFNEAVNVTAADFVLATTGSVAGTIGSISGSGTNSITVNVTGVSGVGSLGLNLASDHAVKDLAGNNLATAEPADDEAYTVDTVAPTLISINRVDSATTNADSVQFIAVFSENVTGLSADDFELTGTATSGASIDSVIGTGNGYVITVSGVSGDGSLGVQLNSAATVTDTAINALTATTASAVTEQYTIDNTAPTATAIITTNTALSTADTVTFDVTFDEAVANVTADDFEISGDVTGTISAVSGSGSSYTVTVASIMGDGALGLSFKSGQNITDAAGNALAGTEPTTDESYTIDNTLPTVTSISRGMVNQVEANTATDVVFTVVMSETVTGIETSDFAVTGNATNTGVSSVSSSDGKVFKVTVAGVNGTIGQTLGLSFTGSADDALSQASTAQFTSGDSYTIAGTLLNEGALSQAQLDALVDLNREGTLLEQSVDGAKEVVIVDSRVPGLVDLTKESNPNADVWLLDGSRSATEQITEILANYNDLDALHILSHGGVGEVYLGAETISGSSITENSDVYAAWGNALSDNGDILLYGCNVAQGDMGVDFINQLAQVTGADIAASDDLTGSAVLGGDWVLEMKQGNVDNDTLDFGDDFESALTTPTFTVQPAATDIEAGQVTLTATHNQLGGIGYVILADGATAPTNVQVAAGKDGDGNDALFSGFNSGYISAGTEISVTIGGLNSGTNYDVYITGFDKTDPIDGSNDTAPVLVEFTTTAAADVPDGDQTFEGAIVNDGVAVSEDGYFTTTAVDGSGNDKKLKADQYGAFISDNSTSTSSYTSYISVKANSGTFELSNVELGEYANPIATDTSNFENIQVLGYLNDVLVTQTTAFTPTSNTYTTDYNNPDFSPFNGVTIDEYRVSYDVTVGDRPDVFSIFGFSVVNATDTAAPANNAPTISGAPSDITVTEDTASNVDLSAVTFADADGDNLTVTLTASAGTFAAPADGAGSGVTETLVNSTTITLVGSATDINTYLDTASNIRYTGAANATGTGAATLTIGAGDGTVNLASNPTVNINITNVNDAPSVANAPSTISVTEDTASNLDLSSVVFADVDNDNLTVTLSIDKGSFSSPADGSGFGSGVTETLVDSKTITLSGSATDINTYLDTASNIQYTGANNVSGNGAATLTISANDANSASLASNSTVSINITEVNDAPTISGASANQAVNDSATLTPFSNVVLADVDSANVSMTVALDTAAKGAFTAASLIASGFTDVGSGSYTLTSMTLASAQAALRALVFDPADNRVAVGLTESTTFTITVNDGTTNGIDSTTTVVSTSINDAPTDIVLSDTTYGHSEGATNVVVGSFSATDADTGESFTYALVSGSGDTDNAKFNINGADLRVTDRASVPAGTYSIRVQVSDGDATYEKAFSITVSDDQAPSISTIVPSDNATGVSVADSIQIAFDENVQLGSAGTITLYDITGSGANSITIDVNNHNGQLSIVGNKLTINPTNNLLATNQYAIQITAGALTDSSNNALAAVSGTTLYNFTTGTVDTTAPTVAIVDIADPTQPNAGTVTINFSEQVTNVDISDFTLTKDGSPVSLSGITVEGSGSAYTLNLSSVTTAEGIYVLTLNTSDITDTSGNALSAGDSETFIIDTTAPAGVAIVRTGAENQNGSAATFTAVFSEAVSGVDAADFVLTGTAAGGSITSVTQVSDSVYTITVNGVSSDGTLGVNLKDSGTGITDTAGNAISAGVTGQQITIDNTGPSVVAINRDGAVLTTADSATYTVTFNEAVTGVDVSDFSLSGGATGTVASITGSGRTYQVTVNNISGDGSLRLDLNASGTGIADTVSNAIGAGFTSGDTLTIDNAAPVVTASQAFNLDEGMVANTVIGQVKATDTNGVSQFSIQSGNDNGYFAIDNNGVVTLTSVGAAAIDYETATSYTLNIVATDAVGQASSAAAVTISINDINDNSPVFSSAETATLAENTAATTVVYDTNATDADSTSAHNSVTYSLKATGDHSAFTIDSTTGEVKLKAAADYETKSSYNFTVIASDGMRSTEQDVTLSITDVNEAPIANNDTDTTTEAGGVDNGTAGTNASGNVLTNDTDVDSGDTKTVTAIEFGATNGALGQAVSGDYGQLTLNTDGSYTYVVDNTNATVQALQAGVILTETFTYALSDAVGLTDTATLVITINGANDNPTIVVSDADSITELSDSSTQNLSDSGTVNFTDVDAADVIDVTFASNSNISWSAGSIDSDLASKLVAGFTLGATGQAAPGSVNWTYSVTDADLNFLGKDETITFSYTVTVTDIQNATATDTVSFTITGTNDAPAIQVVDVTAAITEGTTLTDNGSVTFTDVDLTDRPVATEATKSVTAKAQDGTTDLALTDAQKATIEAAFSIENVSSNINDGAVNWTYNIAETNLDFLGKGEVVTAVFTITVTDDEGATATQDVTVTITGSNDTPDIQVVDVIGAITEGSTLTDSGSITFTDVDLTDRPVATEATKSVTAKAQDGTTDLALTDAQKATIEAAFSIENVSSNINDGAVNWTYNIAETNLDFLGKGEVVTAVFTITVTDDEGATATQDVTVTITGSNDTPDIQVVDVIGAITESSTLTDSGSITFTDLDLTDRPVATEATKSVTAKAQDGTTALTLTTAQQTAIENAFSLTAASGNTNDGTVNWAYNIAETNLDFLGQGEVVTAVFTITVTDDEGATATQDVTVTITGSNDTPDIQVVDVIGAITESSTLTDSGSITFTDLDLTDRPVATEATKSVTAKAQDGTTALTLTTAQQTAIENAFSLTAASGNTNDGTVNWAYNIAETNLDFLGQGEVVTAVFTITVTDDEGATATQDVTVTITGSNDTPDIQVVDVIGAITEGSTLTDSGSITFTDVDLTDRPVATEATKSVTAKAQDGTTDLALTDAQKATIEAAFSIENVSSNINDGAVNWTYNIAETNLDFLGKGEVVTAVFTITVTDDEGATATQDVTVTITGSNDTPDIQVVDVIGAITEGSTLTDTGSVTFTNVDLTDRPVATEATKSVTAKAQDGTTDLTLTDAQKAAIEAAFSIDNVSSNTNDGTVNWTYNIAETNLDFLGKGEVVTAVFTITVTDDEGATATQDVTVTITGSNDAPIVSGTVANMSGTSGQIFTPVTLPANLFSDLDANDQLVWSIENLPTGLVFNAATRTISGTPQGGFEGVNTLQVVATDSNGGQVKVPVTLTLKPSPVTPPVEANPNTTAPFQLLGGGADFNAPDVDPNVESLPSGLIDSGAGVSGFAGESADDVQLVDVAASIDSAVSVVPSPTAESNGQGASNGAIVSESRVSVDVGANGQVRVSEIAGQSSNVTGLTVASLITQTDRVSISLADTGAAASYSATLSDGSSLPSWVEVNPSTGEVTMIPPAGQGKITLKINATDAEGNIRVLEIEVDLDNLPAPVQNELTESAAQANGAIFVPLDEQLAIAAEQFDEYGNDLMKLLAS